MDEPQFGSVKKPVPVTFSKSLPQPPFRMRGARGNLSKLLIVRWLHLSLRPKLSHFERDSSSRSLRTPSNHDPQKSFCFGVKKPPKKKASGDVRGKKKHPRLVFSRASSDITASGGTVTFQWEPEAQTIAQSNSLGADLAAGCWYKVLRKKKLISGDAKERVKVREKIVESRFLQKVSTFCFICHPDWRHFTTPKCLLVIFNLISNICYVLW